MKHKPWRMALTDLAVTLTSLALGLVLVFPIVYGVLGAFKTSAEFLAVPPRLLPVSFLNFSNFEAALDIAPFPRFALNSLAVSLMGTAVRLLFAVLAAYAFAFYDFKGKNALFFLLLATLMLPADTLLVTNYLTVSRMTAGHLPGHGHHQLCQRRDVHAAAKLRGAPGAARKRRWTAAATFGFCPRSCCPSPRPS